MTIEAVRRASADDAPALTALEQDARRAIAEARGGAAVLAELPAHDDWAPALAEPTRQVFVATIDEVVLGYLELLLPAGPGLGGVWTVRQVYVDPGARELGLGDDLLAAAVDAARRGGGVAIDAWALPGDRETKNLFERAGITARKIVVRKRLDLPADVAVRSERGLDEGRDRSGGGGE